MQKIAMAAAFCLLRLTLCAQWLNFKQPGIPRKPDGNADLTAPAPRTPDGKPDLSGLWGGSPGTPVEYVFDVIEDIQDETIFKPAAEALFQSRLADMQRDSPHYRCLPGSPARGLTGNYRIIQSPTVVALLFNSETGDDYRQIFLDGRELPRDPNPTWHGYSVGHWEKSENGDTLVVETTGFNDRSWLDFTGHPHSESLHTTERFRRLDFGHMQVQVTLEDPETMTRPLTLQGTKTYRSDTDMLEGVCEDIDARHLVGRMPEGVKLSGATLVKFAGTYEPRQGGSGPPGQTFTLTVANDQLYLGALRLVPQSETSFQWVGGTTVVFTLDAAGAVTGFRRVFGYSGESAFYVKR